MIFSEISKFCLLLYIKYFYQISHIVLISFSAFNQALLSIIIFKIKPLNNGYLVSIGFSHYLETSVLQRLKTY